MLRGNPAATYKGYHLMTIKLSNSDSRTIRLACEAISMIIDGAMRRLETEFGPNDNPDRVLAQDALIIHARKTMGDWLTSFDNGAAPTERTTEETTLTD